MGLFSPVFYNLRELYVNELRDLYSAETQLIEALPKMAKAAHAPALKDAFTAHLQETRNHAQRLEQLFRALGEDPSGETCKAMQGLLKEGNEYAGAGGDPDVCDAGLIGAAQRVEHYEMAGYGTVRALASRLGETTAVRTLQLTLDEEGAANRKLTEIAETQVNTAAAMA